MNWKRLIKWPWFVKAEKREPMVTGWERHRFYHDREVAEAELKVARQHGWKIPDAYVDWSVPVRDRYRQLAIRAYLLEPAIAKAERHGKKRSHWKAELSDNLNERLRIEGGK